VALEARHRVDSEDTESVSMDVLYFLKERTRLIRDYYEHAARPFGEIIRKIEAEEEPYIPPSSEDPEPAFLSEWIEADELLEVTGRCCISTCRGDSIGMAYRYLSKEVGKLKRQGKNDTCLQMTSLR
jgi:hypothetical protein